MRTDKKIITYKTIAGRAPKWHNANRTIVLTSGCYDLLHLGHIAHFDFCKTQGDICIVSVGNDETVRQLKGPTRPINNQLQRARMIAALRCVDYVVISEEVGKMDFNELVPVLKPHRFVLNAGDSATELKRELITSHGGELIIREFLLDDLSTTNILKKIKETH